MDWLQHCYREALKTLSLRQATIKRPSYNLLSDTDLNCFPSGVVVAAAPAVGGDGPVNNLHVDEITARHDIGIAPRIPQKFCGNNVALVGGIAVVSLRKGRGRGVHDRYGEPGVAASSYADGAHIGVIG